MNNLNPTGIKPVEFKVLIKVDKVEDKVGSIWVPENVQDRNQAGHDRGTLVEIGEMAFDNWKGSIPKVGDKVLFDKYAGTCIKYRAEEREIQDFRLCEDSKIGAIIRE